MLQSLMDERLADHRPSLEPNFETMLRDSVQVFLAGINGDGFDFLGFRSVMSRHLQSSADPPLEIIWLYSATNCYEFTAVKNPSINIRAARDILQLLSAFSSACNGAKSIALIAPVIYNLYHCAVDGLTEKDMKEVEGLVEAILSYVSICCCHGGDSKEVSAMLLHDCFLDLVRVWTSGCFNGGDSLQVFFPLISDGARRRFVNEECRIEYLAGVVIAEAFLLRLSLKVKGCGGAASQKELQKELGIWAVSSITAFCNLHFFEILLKVLLEPKAIAPAILNTEDEKLVRGVLYDAVVLVDYSFLLHRKEIDQSYMITNLLISKLIVANEASKMARKEGDHDKAISYLNAFSTSSLPRELIDRVRKNIGVTTSEKPNNSSPEGLLKWLVQLERMGKRIFDDECSRYATQLIFDDSVQPLADAKKMDHELFFLNNGEINCDEEMVSMDAVFSAAARSMNQPSSNGRAKRKELKDEPGKQLKYAKYGSFEGTDNDSDIEDPSLDAVMNDYE